MIGIIAVIIVSFVLIFVFSLLEVVWLTVYDDDVVSHERSHGGTTHITKTIKALLRERMVVVGFILFGIHLLTYFTPLVLGRLSQGMNGTITTVLVIYAIVLFFLGEIVSKNLGYKWAMRSALLSAKPLACLIKLSWPVTKVLKLFLGKQDRRLYREEDVIAAAHAAREHGALEPREVKLITDAINLGNRRVRDLYIPLEQCLTVTIEPLPTRQELTDAATRHSHIMVRATPGGNILGSITRKDVMAFLSRTNLPPDQAVDLMKELKPCGMVELPLDWSIAKAYEFFNGDDACEVVDDQGRTVGILRSRRVANGLLGIESE